MLKCLSKTFSLIVTLLMIPIFLTPFAKGNIAQDAGYSEDFEDGNAQGWELTNGWKIIEEEGNHVLSGQWHYWAYSNQNFSDCKLSFRIKVIAGDIHLVYRMNDDGRYFITFNSSGSRLNKQYFPDDFQHDLAGKEVAHKNNAWHQVEIEGKAGVLKLTVDGAVEWTYTDPDPILTGSFAFETLDAARANIDDVSVSTGKTSPTTAATKAPQTQKTSSTSSWEQTKGPPGGVVHTIEIDPSHPNILYAGGMGGIFKSTDAGVTWVQQKQFLLEYGVVNYLMLNPRSPNVIYALSDRLFKSVDAGKSWVQLFNGQPLFRIAMDPDNPDRLLVGSNEGKVWLSKDGGSTWQNVTANLPGFRIKVLAFEDQSTLWVGTGILNGRGNGYLYKSTDGGKSWDPINFNQADTSEIQTIFVDSQHKGTVYVGLCNIYNEMGNPNSDVYLVKTTDSGKTWQVLRLPSTDSMTNIMGTALNNPTLYMGTGGQAYASDNGGQSWKIISPKGRNGDMYDIAIDPQDANTLYLPRRAYGIVKSTDGGKNWEPINEGLLNTVVSLISLGSPTGSTIYASSPNGEGIYKSTDFGDSWENVTSGGITHPWADELTVTPTDPQTIWYVADVGEFFKSTNGGQTWAKIIDPYGAGFRAGTVSAAAIAPSNQNIIYALKSGFGIFKSTNGLNNWDFLHRSEVDYTYSLVVHPKKPNVIFSGDLPKPFQNRARVQRSTDAGESWSTVLTVPNSSGITSVVIDTNNPEIMYTGSTAKSENGGGQLYHSVDGGENWEKLNPHFTMLTVWGQPQLVGDPNNPSIVYAATWLAGTWKTTNAGQSWTKLTNAPPSSTSLSIDPSNPQALYAADRTSPKLWKSMDGGSSWEVKADFSSDRAFLLNRVLAGGNSVYVSTFGPGVHDGKLYLSKDGGTTWTDITNGLPRSVLDIAIHPSDPNHVFVTTHVFGAYQTTDGGKTWSSLKKFPDIGAYDIEIDPSSPNILYAAGLGGTVPDWTYAGGYKFKDSAGVYKSTNGGKSWKRILATSNESRAVRIHPSNHNLLFVSSLSDAFFVSTDGGNNWKNYNTGLDSKNLTSLWVNANNIYVGTQGFGVYAGDLNTSTGEVKWVADRSNKPVPDVYNLQIQVDPENSDRIFIGSNPGGLYRSDDGGQSWADKNFLTPSVVVDDPFRQGYYTFAINPADTMEVWVATWGKGIYKSYDGQDFNIGANGADRIMYNKHVNGLLFQPELGVIAATEEGVFYTQDGGTTWVEWSTGLGNSQIRTINLFTSGKVLIGTGGYELYTRRPKDAMWKQVNAFANFGTFWPIWNDRPLYQYSQLLFHPTDANTIYFGTFPAGIYKSVDGGKAWKEYNVGWTVDGVFTLVFHPNDEDTIYAGTYNGINRSLDAGKHWQMWNKGWPGEQWVFSIAFDPNDPDIMYACSKNGENEGTGRAGFHGTVMKSTDGGANWFAITSGLDLNNEFYKIIVDKLNPDILYLATQFDGVHISENAGKTWQAFNDGLTNLQAGTNGNNVTNTMALSEDGKVLYFGSAGSGLFRRNLISLSGQ